MSKVIDVMPNHRPDNYKDKKKISNHKVKRIMMKEKPQT